MVLSIKKARSICTGIIEERYRGFSLMMDQVNNGVYMSLWGLGDRRLEVMFSCRNNREVPVYASEYALLRTNNNA